MLRQLIILWLPVSILCVSSALAQTSGAPSVAGVGRALLPVAAAACPFPLDHPTPITTKRELPASVVAAFGELAEKGEPFQVSDVLPVGAHPPFSRFVSAEARGCELALHYEHGGIGHSWPTARFRFEGGRWSLLSRYDPAR